uniref:Ig-like domain-containing protein n=1 Tax=Hippocampus comes TaxID=109280 RepID=A0A3Q2Y5K0_HIPCM
GSRPARRPSSRPDFVPPLAGDQLRSQLPEGRIGAHRMEEMERVAHEGAPAGVAADERAEKTKPDIVLLPEPTRVLEGDVARFRCRVTGYPAPKVNWYLNGQLIRKSNGGLLSLVIRGVSPADQGVYRCTATNRHGRGSSSARLTVEGAFSFFFSQAAPPPASSPESCSF